MRKFVLGLLLLGLSFASMGQVRAGEEACTDPNYPYCYDHTIINQWACETCPGSNEWVCTHNTDVHCENSSGDGGDHSICMTYDPNSRCYEVCKLADGTTWTGGCQKVQKNVECNTSPGFCRWQGELTNCLWENNNSVCNEGSQITTKSCCGCPNPPCEDNGGGSNNPPPACTATYPGTVSLVSPENEAVIIGTQVELQWSGPSSWGQGCPENHNRYLVYVGTSPTNLNYQTATDENTRHYTFTGTAGQTYYWKIEADNGTYQRSSTVRRFTIAAGVAGTVYLDADNTCSTSQPSGFGGGLTASLRGTSYSDGVDSNGEFAISAPGGSYTLDMTVPSGYVCSTGPLGTGCGGGCPTQTGTTSPSSNNNFFFTQKRSAWWQAVGGNIYAGAANGGTVIRSLIPGTVAANNRYLVVGDDGVVLHRSGSLALDNGEVSVEGYKAISTYKGKKMDFDFWKAHVGVDLEPGDDWAVDSMEKPSYNSGKKYYWLTPTSGTASLAADWSVANGEKYVVFINGDLRINHNITVANGGFLAMIVKGDITVESQVSQLEGIYIADGKFVTERSTSGDDIQLLVGGTVVSWTDVELHRDLGGSNAYEPAEKFSYRLDLIENMPEVMKGFLLHWKEVPAGTFE